MFQWEIRDSQMEIVIVRAVLASVTPYIYKPNGSFETGHIYHISQNANLPIFHEWIDG